MKETWKLAVGEWKHDYYVSTLGRVGRLLKSGKHRTLSGAIDKDGYCRVGLKGSSGKICRRAVHRLIAETFLARPAWGMVVHHLNHNKADNRLGNLCWATYQDNTRYYYEFKNEQEATSGGDGLVGPAPLLCNLPLAGERPSEEAGSSSLGGGLVSVEVPPPKMLPQPVFTMSWSVSLWEGVCFDSRPEHGYTTHSQAGV